MRRRREPLRSGCLGVVQNRLLEEASSGAVSALAIAASTASENGGNWAQPDIRPPILRDRRLPYSTQAQRGFQAARNVAGGVR